LKELHGGAAIAHQVLKGADELALLGVAAQSLHLGRHVGHDEQHTLQDLSRQHRLVAQLVVSPVHVDAPRHLVEGHLHGEKAVGYLAPAELNPALQRRVPLGQPLAERVAVLPGAEPGIEGT
jgi:hypothetical protein